MNRRPFNKEQSELYDKIYPKYFVDYYLNKRVKFIKKYLTKKSLFLDVGCGTGTLIISLAPYFKTGVGIDSSKFMIKKASEKVLPHNVIIKQEDATNTNFKSDKFDFVFSSVTLHHLGSADKIKKAIRQMIRVTKPGGYIVIWELNRLNPFVRRLTKKLPWDENIIYIKNKYVKDAIRGYNNISMKVLHTSFVPNFSPKFIFNKMKYLEYVLEKIKILNVFSGHVVFIIKKGDVYEQNN